MSATHLSWVELDALSAEPTANASRYGFCIISGTPYYWDGSAWNAFATSGGSAVGNMNDVYENGSTVTIDSGAIVYNDATTAALNTLELNKNGAGSGNLIDLDMNLGIAAGGIYIDCGAGARTGADIKIKDDSTGTHIVFDIDSSGSGVTTGFAWTDSYNGNGGNTGVLLTLDSNDGLTSTALSIVRGAGIRTTGAINIDDGSTGSGSLIDIDLTGAYTGNIIDFATSGIATGNVLNVNLDTAVAMTAIHLEGSGVRTQPFIEMASDATGSSNIATFTPSGATWSGNVLQFLMTAATTGDVINIDMNAAVGGKAIYIDSGASTRTAVLIDILADGDGDVDVFNIDESNDGSGNVFDINVSGVGSGNVMDITYSAADTGNALSVAMGTNVAGMALDITSSGTGVSTEGSAINITHDGVLVAGADIVSIAATGAISSTSNALSIATIGDAGSFGLYINATGSAEAIHVDAGTVTFDETLTVTGTTTLGALVYTSLNDGTSTLASTALELTRVADLTARLVDAGATETATLAAHSDRIILLDTAAGSVVTLPAAAGTGAVIRVVVSVLATSNSHIVKAANGSDVFDGQILLVDQDTAGTVTGFVTAATSDTVTLNRSTTGSVTIGEWVEFVDIATNQWAVRGVLTNTGSGATPFSATVA